MGGARNRWASVAPARVRAERGNPAYAAGRRMRRAFYYLKAEHIIRACAAVSCAVDTGAPGTGRDQMKPL
jgi:hypothetical protein